MLNGRYNVCMLWPGSAEKRKRWEGLVFHILVQRANMGLEEIDQPEEAARVDGRARVAVQPGEVLEREDDDARKLDLVVRVFDGVFVHHHKSPARMICPLCAHQHKSNFNRRANIALRLHIQRDAPLTPRCVSLSAFLTPPTPSDTAHPRFPPQRVRRTTYIVA